MSNPWAEGEVIYYSHTRSWPDRDYHGRQTHVCAVCERVSYACRRVQGLKEISESITPPGPPPERVCPRCWPIVRDEFGAEPLS